MGAFGAPGGGTDAAGITTPGRTGTTPRVRPGTVASIAAGSGSQFTHDASSPLPVPLSGPSGTGHRLRPAEWHEAGKTSRELNPTWRTDMRVSNPTLEKAHLSFTERLRDDDPVSSVHVY